MRETEEDGWVLMGEVAGGRRVVVYRASVGATCESEIALDRSGNLLWYNQPKPFDLFDADFQISPILATAAIGGSSRKIVIGAGKGGYVIAFDRATGSDRGRNRTVTPSVSEGRRGRRPRSNPSGRAFQSSYVSGTTQNLANFNALTVAQT